MKLNIIVLLYYLAALFAITSDADSNLVSFGEVENGKLYTNLIKQGLFHIYELITEIDNPAEIFIEVDNSSRQDTPVMISITLTDSSIAFQLPYINNEKETVYSTNYIPCIKTTSDIPQSNTSSLAIMELKTFSRTEIRYTFKVTILEQLVIHNSINSEFLPILRSHSRTFLYSPSLNLEYYSKLKGEENKSQPLHLYIYSNSNACTQVHLYHSQCPPVPGSEPSHYVQNFIMSGYAKIYISPPDADKMSDIYIVLSLIPQYYCNMKRTIYIAKVHGNQHISKSYSGIMTSTNISVLIEKVAEFEYKEWLKIFLFACLFFPVFILFILIYVLEKVINSVNPKFGYMFIMPILDKEQTSLIIEPWEPQTFDLKKNEYKEIMLEKSWDLNNVHKYNINGDEYLAKKYMKFVWGLLGICLFFGIPALQNSKLKQILAREKGNLDYCFYNFKCSQPFGQFYAFNNVWSNVGFILLGILFMCIVTVRHRSSKQDTKLGVPRYLGLQLAMGLSMLIEGIMSGLYHLCPNAANYQYDTLFMFVSLLIINLYIYTNRHSTSNISSHTFLLLMGGFTCLSLLEIFESNESFFLIRSIYLIFIFLLTIILIVNLYYFGTSSLILFAIYDIITGNQKVWRIIWPLHNKHRLIHLSIILAVNFSGSCLLFFLYRVDMRTIFLGIFIFNFIFYLLYYWLMKFIKKEYKYSPLNLVVTFCVGSVGGMFWLAAFGVYFYPVSNWALGPIASRHLNKDCIMWDFYDYHDVWHIFSAYGLFFTYLGIIKIDDNVANVPKENLSVF